MNSGAGKRTMVKVLAENEKQLLLGHCRLYVSGVHALICLVLHTSRIHL
jgi:hypothetical protein